MLRPQVDAIENWAADNGTTRAEAIRRLIELGLKARSEPPAGAADHPRGTDWPDLAEAVQDAEKEKR